MAESDGFVRNFRSTYYEKVGFCGIEEEKVLDTILTSKPLDIDKLSYFCSRFDLARREEAWLLLLCVQCNSKNPFDDEGKVVTKIRNEHFEFLAHHVDHLLCHNVTLKKRLIQLCSNNKQYAFFQQHPQSQQPQPLLQQIIAGNKQLDDSTSPLRISTDEDNENKQPSSSSSPRPSLDTYSINSFDSINSNQTENSALRVTSMYLLEIGKFTTAADTNQLKEIECRLLFSMATVFVKLSSSQQNAYFMFKAFLKKLETNKEALNCQYEQCLTDFAKEMPDLNSHIRSLCDFNELPCWYWFQYCYIDVFDEKSLLRLWDKVIAGCIKCVTKAFKLIFNKLEVSLMACKTPDTIIRILTDKENVCLREFSQNQA